MSFYTSFESVNSFCNGRAMKLSCIIHFALAGVVFAVFTDVSEPACSSLQPSAGKRAENARITGGQVTAPNEFPWQVLINVSYWNGIFHVCGGSLISDEWILSAAHCTHRIVNMTVTLGAHDTSADSNDVNRHQVFYLVNPNNVHSYPEWFYPDLEGDLALIQLPSKASINDYVRPISLPYIDDPSFEGEPVILTGWGIYSTDAELSVTLRKTATFVLGSQGDCQRQANQSFDGANIICGDGSAMHQFCSGDDGGPMNYYRLEEADWVVIGVATWGVSTAECATSVKPNLYNRVTNYLAWIHNTTRIPPRPRPSSSTTVAPTSTSGTEQPLTLCRDKPDGYYSIPGEDCTKYFVECREGTVYFLECREQGTVFSVDYCRCDYPHNVPGCPSYTASSLFRLMGQVSNST